LTPVIHGETTLQWSGLHEIPQTIGPQKEESGMKRLLMFAAAALACAAFPPVSSAETIACAAEVPAARSGHWYYRIIDGRKCWYQGKAMMPKSSLYWPQSPDDEAQAAAPEAQSAASKARPAIANEQAAQPTTDGRNVAGPPATARTAEPAAVWPAPAVNEISFESRWLGLQSRN
jgi:hypothetical protein